MQYKNSIPMIHYKIVGLADPISSGEVKYQYYPRICARQKINLRQVSKDISNQSSFTSSDVYGVLRSFIENLPNYLLQNYSVELDDFGIFSLHAKAKGSPNEKQAKADKIKELKIAFRPNKILKDQLSSAQFKKIKP